jgi:hypothetical protein
MDDRLPFLTEQHIRYLFHSKVIPKRRVFTYHCTYYESGFLYLELHVARFFEKIENDILKF